MKPEDVPQELMDAADAVLVPGKPLSTADLRAAIAAVAPLIAARERERLLASTCPFDHIDHGGLAPEDPCPVCGDLGTFDDDVEPSRCISGRAPVIPPAEVEALKAERDEYRQLGARLKAEAEELNADVVRVAAERDAEHANLETAVILLDGAKAEITTLRARVAELEAALRRVLPYAEAHDDAGPYGEGWKSDEMFADLEAARTALEGKP